MARVVKAREERTDELLDTAQVLFAERGYHDTSVQAITDAAGVAKGLFYHYFDSKEDLLDALAKREVERIFEAVYAKSREIEGVPLDELALLLGMLANWELNEAQALTGALLHVMYGDGNASLRHRLYERWGDLLKPLVTELIDEGNALGQTDVEDPEATAEVLVSMLSGMGDRLMGVLMIGGSDSVDLVVRSLEAAERAAERTLGAAAGTLHVYDHATIRPSLLALIEKGA
ncbi:MAG: TetR/AcrR family transcriptional regulator [Coriobacteriia bacterium]|nr:TetR/AcrR family transcriptional regulator [Coriobacteriia bacterium]